MEGNFVAMNMLIALLVGLFLLTFIGVVVGIVLLIVRKEKWAGIIVAGLSLGIGFCIMIAGLNLVTTNLLQTFSNPFSFSSYGNGLDNYSDDYSQGDDTESLDDYIDVSYGEEVILDDESSITISKPEMYREKADYDVYKVRVKFENTSNDTVSFSSDDVSLYDNADEEYGEQITEKSFSGDVQPGETKELVLYYEVYNFGPYDVEYDNYNWTE